MDNETTLPKAVAEEMKKMLIEYHSKENKTIDENLKLFYCRWLQNWPNIKEYLWDTCLTAQDNYKAILRYFRIEIEN